MNAKSNEFPFSRRGSWLSIFRKNPAGAGGCASAPLSIRVVAGILWEEAEIFDLDLERYGTPIPWSENIDTAVLTLETAERAQGVKAAFYDEHTLRLRAEGVTLRLDLRRGKPMRLGTTGWGVRAGSCSWLLLSPIEGELDIQQADKTWVLRINGERAPAELLIYHTTSGGVPALPQGTLEECADRSQLDLRAWAAHFPSVPPEFSQLRDFALWNTWNLVVHPLGNFKRETMLVSKGTLVGLWSWDHCWHMLGAASIDPTLAWNNMLALFDHQDRLGALPDAMAANQLFWGILKPPVHGWMLGILEARHDWFSDAHRREIYPAIARLTEFWLKERDEDRDGVPHYLDGCDSGWDNATLFDAGFPIETPDLATWLILQQDWLAATACRLGLTSEAIRWQSGAQTLLARMLEHFWTGDRFIARMSGTHKPVYSDSLLLRVPLLLGRRLPKEATTWCLNGLMHGERYRSPFGLLTEPIDSPFFDGDGYWRGPMWPVAVFIFVEAFRANGLTAEADALAMEFLRHVQHAGNYENYRGDDGRGVRDTAIAWTATCALDFLFEMATRNSRSTFQQG